MVGLVRDARGAMLLLGVFFATFMTAALVSLVGIAEVLLFRERMQDSADGAAIAAAVIHARGMNLLVLLNQVMAALLAVLVALRLVEMLATLGLAIAIGLAFVTVGASTAAVAPLREVRAGAKQAHDSLEGPIHDALRALHDAAQVVRSATVPLATAQAVSSALSDGTQVTAFAVVTRLTLPTEDDDFGVLCEHAAADAAQVVTVPLRSVGLPGVVADGIDDAVSGLVAGAGDWFCGKEGARAPGLERKVERTLPTLSARRRCEEAIDGPAATSACEGVDALEAASEPDAIGNCASGPAGGACEERIREAREQCNPGLREGLHGFVWQERQVVIHFTWDGRRWVERGRSPGVPRLVRQAQTSREHPCGSAAARYSPTFATGVPVCAERISLPSPRQGPASVKIIEVLKIYQCRVTESRVIGARRTGAGDGDGESPQRLLPGTAPGADALQLQGLVVSAPQSSWVERVVSVAAWGRAAPGVAPRDEALGRLGIAEAEYGWRGQGHEPPSMWQRRWTVRLRRVRSVDRASGVPSLAASCVAAGGGAACDGLPGSLGPLVDLLAH